MSEGRIKWFDSKKGYGFITAEDGQDIFFHQNDGENNARWKEGDLVKFDVIPSEKGRKASGVVRQSHSRKPWRHYRRERKYHPALKGVDVPKTNLVEVTPVDSIQNNVKTSFISDLIAVFKKHFMDTKQDDECMKCVNDVLK